MIRTSKRAYRLIRTGDPASIAVGLNLLRYDVDARPHDVQALFDYAGAFDLLGREAEALSLYERVLAGVDQLPLDDRPRLYVQLGSTLRNLGDMDRSRQVLIAGQQRFPDHQRNHGVHRRDRVVPRPSARIVGASRIVPGRVGPGEDSMARRAVACSAGRGTALRTE